MSALRVPSLMVAAACAYLLTACILAGLGALQLLTFAGRTARRLIQA